MATVSNVWQLTRPLPANHSFKLVDTSRRTKNVICKCACQHYVTWVLFHDSHAAKYFSNPFNIKQSDKTRSYCLKKCDSENIFGLPSAMLAAVVWYGAYFFFVKPILIPWFFSLSSSSFLLSSSYVCFFEGKTNWPSVLMYHKTTTNNNAKVCMCKIKVCFDFVGRVRRH